MSSGRTTSTTHDSSWSGGSVADCTAVDSRSVQRRPSLGFTPSPKTASSLEAPPSFQISSEVRSPERIRNYLSVALDISLRQAAGQSASKSWLTEFSRAVERLTDGLFPAPTLEATDDGTFTAANKFWTVFVPRQAVNRFQSGFVTGRDLADFVSAVAHEVGHIERGFQILRATCGAAVANLATDKKAANVADIIAWVRPKTIVQRADVLALAAARPIHLDAPEFPAIRWLSKFEPTAAQREAPEIIPYWQAQIESLEALLVYKRRYPTPGTPRRDSKEYERAWRAFQVQYCKEGEVNPVERDTRAIEQFAYAEYWKMAGRPDRVNEPFHKPGSLIFEALMEKYQTKDLAEVEKPLIGEIDELRKKIAKVRQGAE